jgi:hypothetical protein
VRTSGARVRGRVPLVIALTIALAGAGAWYFAGRSCSGCAVPAELVTYSVVPNSGTLVNTDVANCLLYDVGAMAITVRIQEKDPTTQAWEKIDHDFVVPYSVLDVSTRRGGLELFISGMQCNRGECQDIIERWVFPQVPGSYVAPELVSSLPRGTSMPAPLGGVSLAGGTYVPHAQRHLPFVPTKSVLYSGTDYGHIDSLEVDPEGRYLLFHSYASGDLFSIDLLSPQLDIQLEASSAQYPALAATRSLGVFTSPTAGRFFVLEQSSGCRRLPSNPAWVVLADGNNDGAWEGIYQLDLAHWLASPWTPTGDRDHVFSLGWDWQSEF